MEPLDADEVVSLIKASTGGQVESDQLEFFRAALSRLEYGKALAAATKGSVIWRRFPSWAMFREQYDALAGAERRDEETLERAREAAAKSTRELPFWVKRFIVARFLYARFGLEKDMRPFPEQGIHIDQRHPGDIEWMPEDAWVEEAERVSDKDIWGILDPEKRRAEGDWTF